jgi:hypothetical protein
MELEEKQCTIAELQHSLSSRTLSLSGFQRLLQQQCQFSAEVAALVERQKLLEADVSTRKNLSQLQKKIKEVHKKKKNLACQFLLIWKTFCKKGTFALLHIMVAS